jgi:hypothetical protein
VEIELLYFDGCPHYRSFAEHLENLLKQRGIESPVARVLVMNDDDAQRLHFLGSPTVRIDGEDVDASAASRTDFAMQCRLYQTDQGLQGTPARYGNTSRYREATTVS